MSMTASRLPPELASKIAGQPWEAEVRRAFRDETPEERRAREVAEAQRRNDETKALELVAAAVERGEYGPMAKESARQVLAKSGRNYYSLQTVRNIAREAKRRGQAKKKARRG
jgi:hypothetical protein